MMDPISAIQPSAPGTAPVTRVDRATATDRDGGRHGDDAGDGERDRRDRGRRRGPIPAMPASQPATPDDERPGGHHVDVLA